MVVVVICRVSLCVGVSISSDGLVGVGWGWCFFMCCGGLFMCGCCGLGCLLMCWMVGRMNVVVLFELVWFVISRLWFDR